jgi:hypothetical protein
MPQSRNGFNEARQEHVRRIQRDEQSIDASAVPGSKETVKATGDVIAEVLKLICGDGQLY